jgi:hypothetical protein
MASPMAAGAVAVLLQRLRAEGLVGGAAGLAPRDVLSLLVSSAAPAWSGDARDGKRAPIARAGAGRVDLAAAVRLETLPSAGAIASLDFGVAAFADQWQDSRELQLRNLSDETRSYALEPHFPDLMDTASGIQATVTPDRLVLEPGGRATLRLDLRGDAAAMRAYGVGDGTSAMNGDRRLHEPEHDLFLRITEQDQSGAPRDGGDVLAVPVFLYARGASGVQAAPLTGDEARELGAPLFALDNGGGQPGRMALFSLLAEDDTGGIADWLDVDYVGARVLPHPPDDPGGGRVIELLVHTLGARRVPYERIPTLLIDTDLDGAADFVAEIEDEGFHGASAGDLFWNGRMMTAVGPVVPSGPGGSRLHHPAGVDVTARWLILRLDAEQLGYGALDAIAFEAELELEDRFTGRRGDTVGRIGASGLRFDEARPPFVADPQGQTVPAGGRALLSLTRPVSGGDGPAPRALAFYPDNEPSADLQILLVPPGPPVPLPPTATATSSPEPTPSPVPSATGVATPTSLPSATATAITPPETATPPTPSATPSASASPTAAGGPTETVTTEPPPPASATPTPAAGGTPTPDAPRPPTASALPPASPTAVSSASPSAPATPGGSTPTPAVAERVVIHLPLCLRRR